MRNGTSDAIPRQRSKDLVVRAHGEETLVLDRGTGTVHCLPAEVARVWEACTGRNSLAEVASAAGTDEDTAASAVDQLLQLDLLQGRACCNRRRFLQRGAVVGAGVAAAPVIESVIASPALAAGSPQILITGFSCSGDHGIVKSPLTVRMAGFNTGTYDISTTIGPAPSPSLIAGQSFTIATTATLPAANVNVLPSNPTQDYRGLVPGSNSLNPNVNTATPITIVVTNPATGAVVSTFTGTVGPCPCSTDYCTVPDTLDFNATSACTGTPATQASITYTGTGGLPNNAYYITATSLATPTVTYTHSLNSDANGNFTITAPFGANNAYSNSDDIITVTVRQGGPTGQIVRTVPVDVGPCPPIPAGLQFNVTSACTGGGGAPQATLTYTLTGGTPGLAYYWTATSSRAPVVTYSNHANADNVNGNFTATANFGANNQFNAADTVYVTLTQGSATGPVVTTVPVTVGPCPPATPNLQFTVTPACTGNPATQASLTYAVTGGVPGYTYYIDATSASQGVTYSNHYNADGSGNIAATTANFGANNQFGAADTVTVHLRMASATGLIVSTQTVTVGPCPPTPANLQFAVTSACTGGGGGNQATLTYTVTGGVPNNFTYYFDATSTSPAVTYNNHQATNATGGFTVSGNFGGANAFAGVSATVTVNLRTTSATGPIVNTQTVTVGPCPPAASGPTPVGSPTA